VFGGKKIAKKSDVAIGLDVGNFAVKVVQLSQKGDTFNLDSFGYAKINIEKLDGVVEAIKNACAEAGITQKKVNASITPEGVIVRYLTLPEMNTDELKKAMEFEIERYVPFERKDVVNDYMILKERPDSKNMKILLVAAKKDFVENRIKILREAGLDPEVITIDAIVLKDTFQLNYPEKNNKVVGLLNIGAKSSNINIVKGPTSYFMRDIQLGGDNITHLLKEKIDIGLEEAEKIKCSLTLEDKEKFKIIEPVLGNLLNEVYLSFDYYESEFGLVVDEVFVSGGTARLKWLTDFLKENLNREVSVLSPVKRFTAAPAVSQSRLELFSPSLVVATGLALENFS